jgi:hypothetical protein
MRPDGRKNGTARERRTDGSGAVNGWLFSFGSGRFLALGWTLRSRRRSFDVRRSLGNRGGFGLAVRLRSGRGSGGGVLAAGFVPFRLCGVLFHFRNGGGSGGAATLGSGSRRLGDFAAIVAAKLDRRVFVDGAGVRLFFRDAEFREQVQYFVGLDFQLPRQLVNSDLSHR